MQSQYSYQTVTTNIYHVCINDSTNHGFDIVPYFIEPASLGITHHSYIRWNRDNFSRKQVVILIAPMLQQNDHSFDVDSASISVIETIVSTRDCSVDDGSIKAKSLEVISDCSDPLHGRCIVFGDIDGPNIDQDHAIVFVCCVTQLF